MVMMGMPCLGGKDCGGYGDVWVWTGLGFFLLIILY